MDIISDYRFDDAPALLRRLRTVGRHLAALKRKARKARIPVIYVNDNFGDWRSDARSLVKRCSADGMPGAELVRSLAPEEDDYFIIKPRHSGFFASGLDALLGYMGTSRLVITGVSSHQCVLFTANDAYVREYRLKIPRDCIAAPTQDQTRLALRYFDMVLGADTRTSARLRHWKPGTRERRGRAFSGLNAPP